MPLMCNLNYPFNAISMCTHQRWITNPYTHQRLYVKCGHCKACIQEKAFAAANRIRNEYSPDKMVLFVGLTYDRDSHIDADEYRD